MQNHTDNGVTHPSKFTRRMHRKLSVSSGCSHHYMNHATLVTCDTLVFVLPRGRQRCWSSSVRSLFAFMWHDLSTASDGFPFTNCVLPASRSRLLASFFFSPRPRSGVHLLWMWRPWSLTCEWSCCQGTLCVRMWRCASTESTWAHWGGQSRNKFLQKLCRRTHEAVG